MGMIGLEQLISRKAFIPNGSVQGKGEQDSATASKDLSRYRRMGTAE
jgi:hypothetical protein